MTEVEKKDIHEVKNVLKALDAFVTTLGVQLKDGFQLTDLVIILQKFALDPVYLPAVKEVKELVPELKDLDLPEGIEVAVILIMGLPKYIDAFKKGELTALLEG